MSGYDSDDTTVEFCMENFIRIAEEKERLKQLLIANKIKSCSVKLRDIGHIIKKYRKTTFKSRLIRRYFTEKWF